LRRSPLSHLILKRRRSPTIGELIQYLIQSLSDAKCPSASILIRPFNREYFEKMAGPIAEGWDASIAPEPDNEKPWQLVSDTYDDLMRAFCRGNWGGRLAKATLVDRRNHGPPRLPWLAIRRPH
jgi:hypothetical protein